MQLRKECGKLIESSGIGCYLVFEADLSGWHHDVGESWARKEIKYLLAFQI